MIGFARAADLAAERCREQLVTEAGAEVGTAGADPVADEYVQRTDRQNHA